MNEKKRLTLALAIIFVLNIIIIMLVQGMPGAAAPNRRGGASSAVSQIQQRLKSWGCMTGIADGKFM